MDTDAAYRAVAGRDGRFAGQFFLGVRTTGIYCRPGCPAKTPRRENVEFFPSAAAAQQHGYRACLRCRPDAAPGAAVQAGTAASLARAVWLLEERGDATGLHERLGMTDRHLRRLFAQHLGATPAQVLRTKRLQLAREMLAGSALPVSEIALAAGFNSLRRFNDAVRAAFGRTPTQLRREARGSAAELTLRLAFHPPFDFAALLAFFAPRALSGLEEVTPDGAWRRRVHEGFVTVRAHDARHLAVTLPAALAPHALRIASRVRRVFDLGAEPSGIAAHLRKDALLAPFVRDGLRLPVAWDPFEMAVRAILGQQVSVQRARLLAHALLEEDGTFPTAARLAEREIRGMPGVRARAIAELARAVAEGGVRLDGSAPFAELTESLVALPGIGDWTAQLVAMRALGEPDAFPSGDLGLCKATGLTPRELLARAEAWRPWRAYAAAALWMGRKDAT